MIPHTHATRVLAVTLLILGWLTPFSLAQPAAEPDAAADGDDPQTNVLREQTIYVPYAKLRDSFEKNGRGVFLPYEQFQALWKAARAQETKTPDPKPPVGALVTEIENEATIAEAVISVAAKLKIELLTDGWHEVPLRLGDAAIGAAELDGQPARLITDPGGGYKLLVQKEKGDDAQIELSLQYSKAYTKAPGQNSVSLQAPQAPVNRWRIRVDQPGVKVNVHPMIAAAEVPAEDGGEEDAMETVVMAFLGAAPTVRIDWTPKSEGASGLAALATVQAEQQVTLGQGVVRTRTQLRYDITRADLSQLRVEVPADHKVAGIFDPNVRRWDVKTEGDLQQITIELFQPTRGAQNITVDLEQFSGEFEKQDFEVPTVKALDVGRQQGIVVVRLGEGLSGETISRNGLLQLDASELPQNIGPQQWNFAYRYAALPFELKLTVEKIQPRVTVDQLVEAYLEPEMLTLDLLALYDIQRAGVFQFLIDVPDGFEVRQVTGRAAHGAAAVAVDAFHIADDDPTKLTVNLARKALGKVGLFVELERRLDDPNLLSPTGEMSDMDLPVPRAAPDSVERSTGRLVICKPESLRANPGKLEGLRSISFAEAYQSVATCRDARFPQSRPSLAFAFTDQGVSLAMKVQRRKPYVTARQLLTVAIKSGQIKYDARFFYTIRYSGVKSLRIDVPAELVDKINNVTPVVRESRMEPQPDEIADGYVALELSGETELLGDVTLHLEWEINMSDLEVGKPVPIVVSRLKPMGADMAWGQIVVAKSETIDVRAGDGIKGLRPIDPQHDIREEDRVEGAARAFEFHEDWSLTLAATRYKLEEVKRTSIEMAVVRQVVTRGGQISTQALYRMRSARQRIQMKLPSKAEQGLEFDAQPVRINGRAVPLESGVEGELYVPLVGLDSHEPFLLELRYIMNGVASQLQIPEFPDDPAVQKVYLCAYVPEDQALLGASGPWTDEQPPWWYRIAYRYQKTKSPEALIQEVAAGTQQSGDPAGSFPVDGRLYVFSTLKPAGGAEGSLSLATMNEWWFHALIFVGVLGVGLTMLRRSVSEKFTALAVLLIGLILLGVFLPTLSEQVFHGFLFWAVAIVLIVWLVWFVIRDAPRIASRRSSPVIKETIVAAEVADEQPDSTAATESPPAAEPASPSDSDDTNAGGEEESQDPQDGGRDNG